MKVGFLVSGGGTTVANVHDLVEAGRLDIEIAVIIASRPGTRLDRPKAHEQQEGQHHLRDEGPKDEFLVHVPGSVARLRSAPSYNSRAGRTRTLPQSRDRSSAA